MYNGPASQESQNYYEAPSTSPLSHFTDTFAGSSRNHLQSYDGTSPVDTHPSEYDLNIIDEYHTPNFDSDFTLEADFGPLDLPPDLQESNFSLNARSAQESGNGAKAASEAENHTPPRSSALLSYTSHLMSPDLTDSASPDMGYEHASPVAKLRLLGGGAMSRLSSQSTTTTAELIPPIYQRTPALTGSSLEASPEPASVPEYGHNKSPVVRVENFSRGDSPARSVGPLVRNSSKRSRTSRASSHLAAPNEDSSDEGNYESLVHDKGRGLAELSQSVASNHNQVQSNGRIGLDPVMRTQIVNGNILNFSDQAEINETEIRNADVKEWLAKSEGPSEILDDQHVVTGASKHQKPGARRRAKSTGAPSVLQPSTVGLSSKRLAEANSHIPGPGLLLYEPSGDEDEDDDDEDEDDEGDNEDLSAISMTNRGDTKSPGSYFTETPGNSRQTLDAHPWVDPIPFPSHQDNGEQPGTSNSAMMTFEKRALELETASRRATWATSIRRLSETDLDKLLGPEGLLSRLSVSKDKIMEKVDRRGSSLAAKLLPKRSSSNLRRKTSEPSGQQAQQLVAERRQYEVPGGSKESLHERKDSLQGHKEGYGFRSDSPATSGSIRRMSSVNKRPKSPKLNTGGAMAAVTSHIAALGGNGSLSPTASPSPTGLRSTTRNVIRRRPRGESYRAPTTSAAGSGLADLWTKQGGPPLPTLASPPEEPVNAAPFEHIADEEEDAETDEALNERGVSISFMPSADYIIPTMDGFRINIQEVNPRLASYLIERLAQEQLRRYKKLKGFKVKHSQDIQSGSCESDGRCPERGGKPFYPSPKVSKKEIELSHTGFSIATTSGGDANALPEGIITAAHFPTGVPMPPVQRLPAEFECPICFTVKRIQKPSDWSKHVHEDLQPFTCTFPECTEPKSFKRKADWVRHENERHRQLEWWICSMPDCTHKCHRRDNFVQHLVREHKLTEPNAKTTKTSKVRGPAKNKIRSKATEEIGSSEDEVSRLVLTCRSETLNQPQDEPCRFCGNICTSWKKLTVHLARHMEQISIPVLELVKHEDITPDTIISPVEQDNILQVANILLPNEPRLIPQASTNGLPYNVHTKMVNVKQELPGSFISLQHGSTIHSPTRENQVSDNFSWDHRNSQSTGTRIVEPPLNFTPGIDPNYLPPYPYDPSGGSQFLPINAQANRLPITTTTSKPEAIYEELGSLPTDVQASYSQSPPYPIALSQQQAIPLAFNDPRHVGQNHFPASHTHRQTHSVDFSPQFSAHGMTYIQDSNDPACFNGHNQQYFSY